MRTKNQSMTHQQAIDYYFGGVNGLAGMSLPFTCKCGKSDYSKSETGDGTVSITPMPIMCLADTFKHIRKDHKQTIKKSVGSTNPTS